MAIDANPDGSLTRRIFVELSRVSPRISRLWISPPHKEVERVRLPDLRSAESARGDETTPCHGIAIAPDGKSLWINSTVDNAVFAYSLPGDLRLLGHVLLPVRGEIGATADQRHTELDYVHVADSDRLFVSNSALDSVSVIDTATMKQIAVVPVGSVPKRINTLVLR